MTEDEIAMIERMNSQMDTPLNVGELVLKLAEAVGLMRKVHEVMNTLETYYRAQDEEKLKALLYLRLDAKCAKFFEEIVTELDPYLTNPKVRELLWGSTKATGPDR